MVNKLKIVMMAIWMPWCLTMAAKDYAVTDFGAVADGTTDRKSVV